MLTNPPSKAALKAEGRKQAAEMAEKTGKPGKTTR